MSKLKRLIGSAFTVLLVGLVAAPLYAQLPEHLRDYPLAGRSGSGEAVAPMFNGWIRNEDGSITMIFGFANQNLEELVDVPLGPNNKLEPAQFDGVQPTHFPVYQRRGFVGLQERGTFAVNVPADMADTEVVWTLNSGGKQYSVPGRATSSAYEMSAGERALGTLKPAIRFDLNGPESTDPVGITAARITTSVGEPVTLSAYVQDRGNRAAYPENEMMYYPLGTYWVLHQGPAIPEIEEAEITGRERAEQYEGEGGGSGGNSWEEVTTTATFPEPGEYLIRLRVDNFTAPDSQFDNVCCWSNAYVPVTVTE
ncbi:MAG: hypothetical protein MI746_15515 [Pseudomonadales bacterium]|nr:hypothetical protein [Pseudomonadales bacterium]